MTDTRRALGRGLGALIPTIADAQDRPVDVFFGGRDAGPRETPAGYAAEESPGRGTGAILDSRPDGESAVSSDVPTAEPGRGPSADGDAPIGVTGSSALQPVPGLTFAEVAIGAIRPNPRQPRTVFDEDELAELVTSITQIGILQPVVVRPLDELASPESAEGRARFELVVGERRWRAAALAGLTHVPAIVKQTHDDDLLRDALLENLHRSQLNPLEEAAAYRQLLDDFGCTQDDLATRIGRSRPQISNTLRLLRLPALVQRRVAAGVLSAGHARALLGLSDAAAMERLAQRIVAEGLSVRSVEEVVAVGLEPDEVRRRASRTHDRDPQLDDLAARMSDAFDTNVTATLGRRKGRVTIEFATLDDLRRILQRMGLDAT